MTAFVALVPQAGEAAVAPPWLAPLLNAPPSDWLKAPWGAGAWVFRRAGRPLSLRQLGARGLVIGEVISCEPGLDRFGAPAAMRRWMVANAWGPYVHIDRDPATGEVSVLREPAGALEAVVWRRDGWVIVASELPDWLLAAASVVSIDLDRVAAWLVDPTLQTADLALEGHVAVGPGEVWREGRREAIWRPAAFAERRRMGACEAKARLTSAVDRAVAGLANGPVLLELSGGFDSAVVASALARAERPTTALNYYTPEPQGDERAFARAVAQRHGLPLIEAPAPEGRLDLASLGQMSMGFRPARAAIDLAHDEDVLRRCDRLGVEILMTGQGGDSVFLQTASAIIAADGLAELFDLRLLSDLARRQGASVYRIFRQAFRGWAQPSSALKVSPPRFATSLAREAAKAAAPHPWLIDLEGLAPAKRLQLGGLADTLVVHGARRQRRSAALRHPLLAQPVLEAAMAIPASVLSGGPIDRSLARAAFADRLPREVAERGTKGRMSARYGRLLAGELGVMRERLLDGRLVGVGLVDRQVLDAELSVEHLIWCGGYGAVVNLLMLELWVDGWRGRI